MILIVKKQIHTFRNIKNILEVHKIDYKTTITDNCFIFLISDSPYLFMVFEILDILSERIVL